MTTLPSLETLYTVIEGTWPPAESHALGPWKIRLDNSGSSRVSAATAQGPVTDADIPQAENAMRAAGQTPLFMVRAGEDAFDDMLAARGYATKDITNLYAAPVAVVATKRPPPVTSFEVWPPLAAQEEIWAAGGIGEGRLAIMARAPGPKTTLLGRLNDRPAGTVFVSISAGCAMIHALEIATAHRRQGLAQYLTRAAAFWAQDNGADYLTLVTTQVNDAANALYSSLGMTHVGQYHYRRLPE
jgi:GNAT superfamily N-acetyltransferase